MEGWLDVLTGGRLEEGPATLGVLEADVSVEAAMRVYLYFEGKPALPLHPSATLAQIEAALEHSSGVRAGGVTVAEYLEASVDPCLAFSEPVMGHMNGDHGSSLKQYVEVLVGCAPVKSARMKRLDRLGFDVQIARTCSEVAGAQRAKEAGASRYCMGAAWRSPKDRDMENLKAMISGVRDMGMETCATLGMLTEEQAKELADAGLDYYNHNIDTSEEFYGEIIILRVFTTKIAFW